MANAKGVPEIERFRITRTLGASARDGLYVAHDPLLDRQVSIRTLTNTATDAATRQALLEDARRLSRFRHPNIAPIFEAGDYADGVYLVFEYVEGETLDRILAQGALPIDRALALMRELLDAVASAHEQGILHGALQPANVTVGAEGHARITGLGMVLSDDAAAGESHLPDTPYYLAPEQLRGDAASERSDVFSLGALFFEMLTGERAFSGAGVGAILEAMQAGNLEPPSRRAGNGDERFDALVLRALSPDPAERFDSVRAFRDALVAAVEGVTGEPGDAGSPDFILRRIRRKPDFPGISSHIREITQCSDDTLKRSVAELSNAVLKDYATTQKLLRLANSPFYSNFGGNIRTVSRAIVLLGFEQVRTAALGLVLFENLKGGRHSGRLMEALVGTLFSAMLARDLAQQVGGVESEQAFVCALFHDIGRMLVLYYLPEEADEIQIRVGQGTGEGSAARQVLGISYEALARSVLEDWNFPREIVTSVERAPSGTLPAARDADQRLHRIVTLASEMGQCITHSDREQQEPLLADLRRRYQHALGVDARGMQRAIKSGREHMDHFLAVVKLPPEGREPLNRLKANLGVRLENDEEAVENEGESTSGEAAAAVDPTEQAAGLMEALTDMLDSMVGDFDLNTLMQTTLETLYQTLGLRRVMLMLADRERRVLVAHTAFGREAEALSGRLRLSLSGKGDILSLALEQKKDLVITDSFEASISRYIPDEFRQALDARSFLLLPLAVRDRCVGLLYLELPEGRSLDPVVLKSLKAVRNQMALAIRQGRD